MIVAVVAVRVMQVAIDKIIDMVAVRDRLVAAVRAVSVIVRMLAAGVLRRAVRRILFRDVKGVLLDLVSLGVMEVAVV